MLKALGSLLVFAASVLYGWKVRAEYAEHVEQLVGMKEMFLMLWGEISYARTPLQEAFLQIAAQGKEPFSSFLEKAAGEMEGQEGSMGSFWKRMVDEEAGGFLPTPQGQGGPKRGGGEFWFLGGGEERKNLELYIGQAETLIQKAQEELKDRQRLSATLSLMCGLFVIILLI